MKNQLAKSLIVGLGVAVAGLLMGLGVTQEVPFGSLSGRLTMSENGKPLANVSVMVTPIGMEDLDAEGYVKGKAVLTDSEGRYRFDSLVAGSYEVTSSARYHRSKTRIVQVVEGSRQVSNISVDPTDPELRLYASKRVFTPDERASVEVHGFGPTDALEVKVQPLNIEAIPAKGGPRASLSSLAYRDSGEPAPTKLLSEAVLERNQPLTKRDVEGAFIEELGLESLKPGSYWVSVKHGKRTAGTFITVTRLALITKVDVDNVLCYATDILTGEPVEGAEILAAENEKLVSKGKTGADGTLRMARPGTREDGTFLARKGENQAFTGGSSYRQDGGRRYQVGWLTDRPVYRPGDLAQFKGVVRERDGTGYKLPAVREVKIEILDGEGGKMQSQTLPVNEHGSFQGSFATSDAADPGIYTVRATLGDENHDTAVEYAAYRKPEFTVKVSPESSLLILGETARIVVDCRYYFGSPVPGAKVTGYVFRNPVWGSPGESDEFESEDYERPQVQGGEFNAEIEGTTDDAGRITLTFPTRGPEDEGEYETDFDYSINLTVSGPGDKAVSQTETLRVCRGEFGITLETDRGWLRPNETTELTAKLIDNRTRKPVTNQEVSIEAGLQEYSRRGAAFIPRQKLRGVTDSDGLLKLPMRPDLAGTWLLKVASRDGSGRWIRSEQSLWVEGDAPKEEKFSNLQLLLDRRDYAPGDTIKALIRVKQPGGSALVSLENDRIHRAFVVRLDKETTSFELPAPLAAAPVGYVKVSRVFEKRYTYAEKTARIGQGPRKLDLQVEVPPKAKPGDRVEVAVKATDAAGKPVSGEVALSLVDESVYAIRADRTDLLADFYPRRYNSVDTTWSFPEVYLDGGDKGGDIPLRSRFQDTAAWEPNLVLDAQGNGTLVTTLPDNLGEWRARAVMVSDRTEIGMAVAKFKAKKDLMVRLSLPQYLVQGDDQEVTAIVTNDSDREQSVSVTLDVQGAEVAGNPSTQLVIAPGGTKSMAVQMTANSENDLVVTATARGQSAVDGVRQNVSVQPFAEFVPTTAGGRIGTGFTFPYTVAQGIVPSRSQVEVRLTAGILPALESSLDQLIDFPYGCTEQTMSRMGPALIVRQLAPDGPLSSGSWRAKLPKVISDGFSRLGKLQTNAGWGWWESDEPDEGITALVLDGLAQATKAGEPIRSVNLKAALDWAAARVKTKMKQDWRDGRGDRLYLSYALALHGRPKPAELGLKTVSTKGLSAGDLALGSLAYGALGDLRKRDQWLSRIRAMVEKDASGARLPGGGTWYGEEPTGLALRAFVEANPKDPLIDPIAQQLMYRRGPSGWSSTRSTNFALAALTRYVQETSPTSASGVAEVLLDGKVVKTVSLDGRPDSREAKLLLGPESLEPGNHQVQVRGVAGGWVSTQSRLYVRAERLRPIASDRDLSISRGFHLMEVAKLEDGTRRLQPSKRATDRVKSGETVACILRVEAKRDFEYVMVEVPHPSNMRSVEESASIGDEWSWWWSTTVVRDDRVAFFARRLAKGKNEFQILLRAESPGRSRALPARVANMYDQAKFAASGATQVEVVR